MSLGAFKTQAIAKQKLEQQLQTSYKDLLKQEQETEQFRDISFNITSDLIDKRFKESKQFLKTGTTDLLRYKKSTTQEQKRVRALTRKQYLQSRNRYSNSVSNHNKKILDMKMKSSFKSLKNIL
jgi:hypothetical protein